MLIWPCLGWPCPPNCRVLGSGCHFTVAKILYYPWYELLVPGSKGAYSSFTPRMAERKCVYGHVLGDCSPKLPRPWGGWSFYGKHDREQPTLWVTAPWVKGLFGTYCSLTIIMAEQKCVYGPIWGDPVPPNCRVLKADGHFTIARSLYYPYYELPVPGS